MPTSGKGPQVTAGQKGPKEPIRSPKNNPARSPGETESDGDRPRRFHACFPWESPRPCFLPAVRVALVPLGCVKGTRRSCEPGGRPGAIFGKEFGSPSSKSAREVPGPFPRVAPRPVAALLAASRSSPSAGLFLERETTPEKLQRQVLPAQAPREATAPRASRGSHSVPARFACSALKI